MVAEFRHNPSFAPSRALQLITIPSSISLMSHSLPSYHAYHVLMLKFVPQARYRDRRACSVRLGSNPVSQSERQTHTRNMLRKLSQDQPLQLARSSYSSFST